MDFIDRIRDLAAVAAKQLEYCLTEEATKTALVMPFINALGYNVFDPREVLPEFVADIGIKKGEKIDYAIFQNGAPIMFFECKWSGADLNQVHASQLYRYFAAVQQVRFGILTNGIEYRFFTDLDAPNRMDEKPFFEFDLLDFQDRHVEELKKFTKTVFHLEDILTTASELKYTAAISRLISQEFEQPSDNFVRFFAKQVYTGILTQPVRDQFAAITKRALNRYLNDRINELLTSAMKGPVSPEKSSNGQEAAELTGGSETDSPKQINTTAEEIEALFAVKAILRDVVDVKRVRMRDTKSYCGILLDDNNRQPICRLYFDREQKQIGVFDEARNEKRAPIEGLDDIYQYAEAIINRARLYEGRK
jgi:hypothetical protein